MTDPRVQHASTITLFVHGVGAHDASNMARCAESGFWAGDTSKQPDARTRDLHLDLGAGVPNAKDPPNAFSVRAGGETHVVVPVVWCNFRRRIRSREPQHGFLRALDGSPAADLLELNRSIPRVLDVCADALLCADAATTPLKKLLLRSCVGVLMAIAGVACLFVLAAVIAPVLLGLSLLGTVASDIISDGRVLAGAVFAVFLLAIASRVVLSPYDYVGDVASYVASESFRNTAIRQFAVVLNHVAKQAPQARVFVVGHSLGSVLVSHALLKASLPDGRKPTLVTLGSPLVRMSRWFSSIEAPQRLLRAYRDRQLIEKWHHFWRDGDYIGRALMPNRDDALYTEKSLGPGGHANYWGDVRLWRELVAIVR